MGKGKTMDFSETIVVYDLKLVTEWWLKWQDVSADIKISSPRDCQPLPLAIYMYKIMKKKCLKSDFKEIFLNF